MIKKVEPPNCYLGVDIIQKENYWLMESKTYIKECITKIKDLFGTITKSRVLMSPGNHPETDSSPCLTPDDKELYQMLIGMSMWVIMLGRFNIMLAINVLSWYSGQPREGHFD